jgi:hypothetical protein
MIFFLYRKHTIDALLGCTLNYSSILKSLLQAFDHTTLSNDNEIKGEEGVIHDFH